jgi:acetolactate decarboxylase
MKKYYLCMLVVFTLLFPHVLCAQEDILTQISTIDALLTGIYDGETEINELEYHGNFGLGTYNALDGEMVLLNGRFYKITGDGTVIVPEWGERTPFAVVTFFETDQKVESISGTDFQTLEKEVDTIIPTPNIFYALKIEGFFQSVKTRSVPKQEPPYRPLTEIVQTQPEFTFKNVEGTMVGFRCPSYVEGINVPGYHLHFITADEKGGGHVLEFTVLEASLEIDHTHEFFLILSSDKTFYELDLSLDSKVDMEKVER